MHGQSRGRTVPDGHLGTCPSFESGRIRVRSEEMPRIEDAFSIVSVFNHFAKCLEMHLIIEF